MNRCTESMPQDRIVDSTSIAVSSLLEKLHAASLTAAEYRALVRHTIALSRKYVAWLGRRSGYTFEALGLSNEDAAIDAIAEFVSDGPSGPCHHIRQLIRAMDPASAQADTAAFLEARYTAAVYRTVQQYLPRVFADINPLYARLLRTLRQHVKQSESYGSLSAIDGRWYGYEPGMHASLHLGAMPETELRACILHGNGTANPVLHTLESALATLRLYPQYRQAVQEPFIIKAAIEKVGSELEQEQRREATAPGFDETAGVETTIHDALLRIQPWLHARYVDTGKLRLDEAEAILASAEAFIMDNPGGKGDGFYTFLHEALPSISYDYYRDSLRHKTEYIVRRIFSTMRDVYLDTNEHDWEH